MFYTFNQIHQKTKNRNNATEITLKKQVMPVTIASASIALACVALLASRLPPLQQLGFLAGIGILSAWLTGMLITPFLLKKIKIQGC